MHTIELTDDELRLALAAVRTYLDDFGHEEADVLRRVKALAAKLAAEPDAGARPLNALDALTVERVAELLREAERAHADYERELGARDEDWPAWYAQHVLDRLTRG